ncbi:MAG: galactose oxidase-like domain-containing protein, partial [Cyanobacteria bacterium P01_D01_bin.116]
GNSLTVDLTSNRNLAPPGWYMLTIVDNNNVPSVAKWISIR